MQRMLVMVYMLAHVDGIAVDDNGMIHIHIVRKVL